MTSVLWPSHLCWWSASSGLSCSISRTASPPIWALYSLPTRQNDRQRKPYARVLFIDFSSAFNTIIHSWWRNLGCLIVDCTCNWVLSFLTQWQQEVRVGNKTLRSITLRIGSPQGSVLSLLLFSLLTSPVYISAHFILFILPFLILNSSLNALFALHCVLCFFCTCDWKMTVFFNCSRWSYPKHNRWHLIYRWAWIWW